MDISKVLEICSHMGNIERNIFQIYDKEIIDMLKSSNCDLKYANIVAGFTTTCKQLVDFGFTPAEAQFMVNWTYLKDNFPFHSIYGWTVSSSHQLDFIKHRLIEDNPDTIYPFLCRTIKTPDIVNANYTERLNRNPPYIFKEYEWKYTDIAKRLYNQRSIPTLQTMAMKTCVDKGIDIRYNLIKNSYEWNDYVVRKCVVNNEPIPEYCTVDKYVWGMWDECNHYPIEERYQPDEDA